MLIIEEVKAIQQQVWEWKQAGYSVGLVPTMGSLHAGHSSLIDKAVEQTDRVVVTLFVNPTQFGPNEDLDNYPRSFEQDKAICEKHGAAALFAPRTEQMYPEQAATRVQVSGLTSSLCGKSRPGHFEGVCTIVAKLFNCIPAHKAFFGEKDAQQLAIIKRMTTDLNFEIEIVGCPIIREADGLAMSSRNSYLTPQERKAATIIHKTLVQAQDQIAKGEKSTQKILHFIETQIAQEPLAEIDYIEAVAQETMLAVSEIQTGTLFAVAIRFGKARLLDNFIIK